MPGRKRSRAIPSGSSPATRTVISPSSSSERAVLVNSSTPGVGSENSVLKSCRSRATSAASLAPARRTCISRFSMPPVSLPDEVRAACAWVAERARWVRVEEETIAEYVSGLPQAAEDEPAPFADDPETAAAFAICMNAINFGSGWWPTIRKRPDHSGYGTMAAGVTEWFEATGPWSAEELQAMDAEAIA